MVRLTKLMILLLLQSGSGCKDHGDWDLTVAKVAVVAAGKGRVSPGKEGWNSHLLERCFSPVQGQGGHSTGRRYNDKTVIIV